MPAVSVVVRPLVAWLNRAKPPRFLPLSDYERVRYELKQCDVLLVEGRTRISEVVKLVTQSPWSHAALYIGRIHDIEDPELRTIINHHYQGDPADQLIIESQLGLGTVVRSLVTYELDHVRISRPSGLSFRDSQQVIRYAVSRLGTDYDVRQIFDLARFLFPWWILPRKWRSSLFQHRAGMPTRTVCSTMIAEAFGYVQFPILPLVKHSGDSGVQLFRRNPRLCTPSDFDYSPYFEIIKYPFLDFNYHVDYRLLPWHGNAELTGEEAELYLHHSDQPSEGDVDSAIRKAVDAAEHDDAPAAEPSADGEGRSVTQDPDTAAGQASPRQASPRQASPGQASPGRASPESDGSTEEETGGSEIADGDHFDQMDERAHGQGNSS